MRGSINISGLTSLIRIKGFKTCHPPHLVPSAFPKDQTVQKSAGQHRELLFQGFVFHAARKLAIFKA
jgi:hypothetical protein